VHMSWPQPMAKTLQWHGAHKRAHRDGCSCGLKKGVAGGGSDHGPPASM
jgi:hypothetical protein